MRDEAFKCKGKMKALKYIQACESVMCNFVASDGLGNEQTYLFKDKVMNI